MKKYVCPGCEKVTYSASPPWDHYTFRCTDCDYDWRIVRNRYRASK